MQTERTAIFSADFISRAPTTILSHMQNAHDTVRNCVSYLGRSVTYLADTYLPHPVNVIAKTAYVTLPFFILNAALHPLGFTLSIGAIITYTVIISGNEDRQPGEPSPLSSLASSLQKFAAVSSFFSSVENICRFMRYKNTFDLICGISEAIFGTYMSFESGLGEELFRIRFRRSE